MTLMTQSEFARHIGKSRQRVGQMKSSGRLILTDDGMVDVEASVDRLARTEDLSKSIAKPEAGNQASVRFKHEQRPQPETPTEAPFEYDYLAERARREHSEANISAMKDAQLAGKLVDASRVTQAITDLAMTTRSAIERIPDRIGMQLAGESDPARIYQILEDELMGVCREIAESASAMPEKLISTEQ